MKKFIAAILCLFISFSMVTPCQAQEYIYINKTQADFETGDTLQLLLNLIPEYITWSSSDPSVTKVSKEGVVTAVSKGQATISATIFWYNLSCSITVEAPAKEAATHLTADQYVVVTPLTSRIYLRLSGYKLSDTKHRTNPMKTNVVKCSRGKANGNRIALNLKKLKAGYTIVYVYAKYKDGTEERIAIHVITLDEDKYNGLLHTSIKGVDLGYEA